MPVTAFALLAVVHPRENDPTPEQHYADINLVQSAGSDFSAAFNTRTEHQLALSVINLGGCANSV